MKTGIRLQTYRAMTRIWGVSLLDLHLWLKTITVMPWSKIEICFLEHVYKGKSCSKQMIWKRSIARCSKTNRETVKFKNSGKRSKHCRRSFNKRLSSWSRKNWKLKIKLDLRTSTKMQPFSVTKCWNECTSGRASAGQQPSKPSSLSRSTECPQLSHTGTNSTIKPERLRRKAGNRMLTILSITMALYTTTSQTHTKTQLWRTKTFQTCSMTFWKKRVLLGKSERKWG